MNLLPHAAFSRAFSLVELLVVVAIMAILGALALASIAGMGSAGSLNKAASDLSDIFAQARAYAMGNNTYCYVGFAEMNAAQPSATGIGRVEVAVVAATGGTRPYDNTPGPLSATEVVAIARLQDFTNLHITSAASLISGNMSSRPPSSTVGFVDLSAVTSTVTFQWPLSGTPQYTFNKVVEFDPRGVARVQTQNTYVSSVPSYIELPLLPTHGTALPAVATNEAAIQVDGMTGVAQIYRP